MLDAAFGLFLRQGYHATSMRQIAREAGIGLSSAYNHFAGKEDIFDTLIAERNMYAAIANALSRATGDSAAELLESAAANLVQVTRQNPDFIRLVFIDALEFEGRHIAQIAGEVAVPTLVGFFQRVQSDGADRSTLRHIPAPILGRAFLGLFLSAVILETLLPVLGEQLPAADWQRWYLDVFLHGVLRPAPLTQPAPLGVPNDKLLPAKTPQEGEA